MKYQNHFSRIYNKRIIRLADEWIQTQFNSILPLDNHSRFIFIVITRFFLIKETIFYIIARYNY